MVYRQKPRHKAYSSAVSLGYENKWSSSSTDCIRLTGLPRSAKPTDVLRLAKQIVKTDGGLENIAEGMILALSVWLILK